ncbi:MAG: hypothetical protein ACX932_02420 [Gammaproteobacteria bacterium]
MKKNTVIISLLLLCTNVQAALADSSAHENGCSILHVQIANDMKSQQSCRLISTNIIHGNMDSSPPQSIIDGNSSRFDMVETFYGPEIELTYNCNDKQITFKTQQGYCMMFKGGAGAITTEIKHRDLGINAKPIVHKGSWLWSRPGQVTWSIYGD